MALKRSWPTERIIKPGIRRRIFVPQSPERVVKIPSGDAIRPDVVAKDSWWFTIHRRGVRRPEVGIDPLEARAAPEWKVNGYLHERVMYKFLNRLNFYEPGDFTFQSSREGGRVELGGMVVDFLFHTLRIAIQVQGPQHKEFLQTAKDKEQQGILAEMGYTVEYADLDTIRSEYLLEDFGRRTFGLSSSSGGGIKSESSLEDTQFHENQIAFEIEQTSLSLDKVIASLA